jgi:hypothetical protein
MPDIRRVERIRRLSIHSPGGTMGDNDRLKIAKKNMKRAQKAIAKEQKRHEKVRDGKGGADSAHDDH